MSWESHKDSSLSNVYNIKFNFMPHAVTKHSETIKGTILLSI